ncbi:MAG TPA: cation diffusion facilitator family transporter [Candidatus Sulfotelmatobacter sp.]|jgi:cobalt-zinc-cadmium efflux system protein|nr:cation diffusion facilitator family transporter [Candidatus Sulfotelmatobacter sp.]
MSNETRTLIALGITFAFMLIEVAGGLISGSLALLADAAHMLADVLALGLTWGAFRFGRMLADGRRSYGYRRLEVLAAWINGVTVLGLSVGIVAEAVLRLIHPEPVQPVSMMGVAVAGFVANLLTFKILGHHGHGHDHGHEHGHGDAGNLNMHGAILHVLGDLLGSVAAILAAGIIWWTGWTPIDPILSIALSLLIVFSGIGLVRKATHILMEGSPEGFSAQALRDRLMQAIPGLTAVHHVHAWLVGAGQPMLTLHAVVARDADRDQVLHGIKTIVGNDFGFSHSVVQVEGEGCGDEGEVCI